MFSSLFAPLAGEVEERQEPQEQSDDQDPKEGTSAAGQAPNAAPVLGLDIWGLASAVTNSVKAHTQELVKSVAQTDWKSELMAFSKEAAEEGKNISHKTAELVEHLPEVVESASKLPQKAERGIAQITRDAPEVSTTITQVGGSIKTFGATLFMGTKELIEQVRDAVEGEIAQAAKEAKIKTKSSRASGAAGGGSGSKLSAMAPAAKYNRFEADVAAMQRDSSTYCDEPADQEDFQQWRSGFSLEEAQPKIDSILAENSFMSELYVRIVPAIVDSHDFWLRYFYRLHKLQQREEARQALTQRAKAMVAATEEEEELGWDDLDAPAAAEDTAAPAKDSETAVEAASASCAAETGTGTEATVVEAASGRADAGAEAGVSETPAAEAAEGEQRTEVLRDSASTVLSPEETVATSASTDPAEATSASQQSAGGTTAVAAGPAQVHAAGNHPAGATGRVSAEAQTPTSVSVTDGSPKASDLLSVPDEASSHGVLETCSDGGGSRGGDWCVVSGAASGTEDSHPAGAAAAGAAGISGRSSGAASGSTAVTPAAETKDESKGQAAESKVSSSEAAVTAALASLSVITGPTAAPTSTAAADGAASASGKASPAAGGSAQGTPQKPQEAAEKVTEPAKKVHAGEEAEEDEDETWGDWD